MIKKTKICLNSMVGNESKTIMRMLESVAPYIDYYVIQCNGNDNTQQKIEDFFNEKNIPGFTYNVQWEYPGWNRDHTLQRCLNSNHQCDWILRMDADETLHVDENFDWSVMEDTSIQSFNIVAQNGGLRYFRTWFWNSKLPFFFAHDKRHETIHLPEVGENFQRINMPEGFRHIVSQDGDTWFAPRKFLRDALELEIDKVVGYKVLEDPYHLWYIAKSYADCYGNPNELPFGRKHSEEYARRSIWYFERFLELTQNWNSSKTVKKPDEMAYFAMICMAWAYRFLGMNKEAEEHYQIAEYFSPSRNEHIMYHAFHLNDFGKYDDAIKLLDRMIAENKPNPFPDLSFLIEDRAYLNTSNFLIEFKESLEKKLQEHIIDSESITFDFP